MPSAVLQLETHPEISGSDHTLPTCAGALSSSQVTKKLSRTHVLPGMYALHIGLGHLGEQTGVS